MTIDTDILAIMVQAILNTTVKNNYTADKFSGITLALEGVLLFLELTDPSFDRDVFLKKITV